MPHGSELFIAIAIFELAAIFVLFQSSARLWPRIGGAFLVAFTAAIARNIYYGRVNRETITMSLIHSAAVTALFTLTFLIRWRRRK
jgi:hypothetical protein